MVMGNPEGTKDDQLEQLQTEIAIMKIQMMGQLVGQMALIQNLARGQEELRTLVNKLHQDGCNHMKQTDEIGDQVIIQPPMRQETGLRESRPSQIATTSRAQQQPRQQQGNQHKRVPSDRQFTKLDMPISQVL